MNRKAKKVTAVAAVAAALALTGCSNGITVAFDVDKPWVSGENSYEQLHYAVSVYDCTNGDGKDERVEIASGTLDYDLDVMTRIAGTTVYDTLKMRFSVTYNDTAPEKDRGLTDVITSTTEFQNSGLAASAMTKSLVLADRAETENLSYDVTADYFGEKKATRLMTKKPGAELETMDIPSGTFFDNEMMFFLARSTALNVGSTPHFYMTNIFDSFNTGNFVNYTMSASCGENLETYEMDEWVKDYGVEAVTAEDGTVTYPVSCYTVDVKITDDHQGPPYKVRYTEKPFVKDGKEHGKIPVTISYTEYNGSKAARVTEYTLASVSFDKPAQ